jgi:hypothetical protein
MGRYDRIANLFVSVGLLKELLRITMVRILLRSSYTDRMIWLTFILGRTALQ